MNRFLNYGKLCVNCKILFFGHNNKQLKFLTSRPDQFGGPFPFPLFLSKLPKIGTPPLGSLTQY